MALGALRGAHMVGWGVGYCTLEAYFYVRRGADVGPMPRHQTFSANLSDGPVGEAALKRALVLDVRGDLPSLKRDEGRASVAQQTGMQDPVSWGL